MKKTFKYMTLAAAAMLTAACSQEDLTTSYQDDPNAVQITAQVGEGDVSGGFVTRSTPAGGTTEEEGNFKSGDRISVSTADQGPVVYAFDGSAWSPENGKFLKWTSSHMTFTAYYPVAEGVDENTFVVPTDQTEANKIADADYMTYSSSVDRAQDHNGVNLQMQRKMARIVINPILQTQFDEYTVTAVTVHGNTAGYSDGNLTTEDVAVNAYKHTNGNFYALLSPTTANNDNYFIDVTVTKGDLSVTLHAKGIPATTAGNSYTINLTVGRNVANITGITINEWTSGATIGSAEADLVPYVTFSAQSEQTFTMDFKPDNYADEVFSLGEDEYFEYSVGGGKWTNFTTTVSDVAFGGAKGNLRLRGKSSKGTATKTKCYSTIKFTTSNSPVQCTGDIRTLIDYENYATASTENARFINLFKNNTQLTSAPELPATTLADGCYRGMFLSCSSLTTAPALPATTLAISCYLAMFNGCSALTTAPELPATTLVERCYDAMFFDCTSLTTAPELPATTLAEHCYNGMFRGCTSLTTAVLPAKILVAGCYMMMFWDCTNLSNLTMLATDVSATDKTNTPCTSDWLYNAGSSASTRTLTLANKGIHDTLFPTNFDSRWKEGAEGTTVIYRDNSSPSKEGEGGEGSSEE